MIDQQYQKFEESIEKLFSSLSLESEKEEIKKNIIASLYFNYLAAIMNLIQDDSFKQKLKNPEELSSDDFNVLVEEGKKVLTGSNINYEETFTNSCNTVLNDFISELEPKLTPEKTAELRTIIAQ